MDIKYLKEVTDVLSAFMSDNGFSTEGQELGTYVGEFKTYKIAYTDDRKMFSVSVAPAESDSFTELSSWFFDESDHGAKDTACIGEDFLEAIAKDAGITVIKAADGSTKEIALPEKAALGTEPDIGAFTQKFLAMFPQYKETYKEMVAKYGDFLYVEFFKRYGVERMTTLMANEVANKKQLTKYWNMLGDMHYEGELVVGDVICSVILCGAFGKEPQKFDEAAEKYLADYPFLKSAGSVAVHDYKHNRKLRKLLEN